MTAAIGQVAVEAPVTLSDRLADRTRDDPQFWTFASASRSGGHALFQYPAMMVPELQGALLDDLLAVDPTVQLVYDPFVGSGTVLLESIYRGLSFHGTDVNPLAVLLSQVKAQPPRPASARTSSARVLRKALAVERPRIPSFAGRSKWFRPEVARDLARIRSAIADETSPMLRRYLWICMAETIRLVSNSRTSTFKLHVYDATVLKTRRPDAMATFRAVTKANASHLESHWERRDKMGADAHATLLQGAVDSRWTGPRKADALMTSPPYGDNKTTVPYGQHSYLPLQWIDPRDIPGGFDPGVLDSTGALDSRSLGGSLVGALSARKELCEASPALAAFLPLIEERPALEKKVLAFVRDYRAALQFAFDRLRPNGYSFLTLGERRVGGNTMPLVAITRELLEAHDQLYVDLIERRLFRKRMATANSEGETMRKEFILVMRAPAGDHVHG